MELNKFSAHFKPTQALSGDTFCQRFGKHNKWDTGYKIIDLLNTQDPKMMPHIFSRVMDNGHSGVMDRFMDLFYKNRIDLENDEP